MFRIRIFPVEKFGFSGSYDMVKDKIPDAVRFRSMVLMSDCFGRTKVGTMLVGRMRELKALEARYRSDSSCIVAIGGWSGVGKTELMRAFCEGKPHVYWCAPDAPREVQMQSFLDCFARASDCCDGRAHDGKGYVSDSGRIALWGGVVQDSNAAARGGIDTWQVIFERVFSSVAGGTGLFVCKHDARWGDASFDIRTVASGHDICLRGDDLFSGGFPATKLLVILDEFSRVVRQDPAALEGLRIAWKAAQVKTNMMLVLCESDLSFVMRELLADAGVLSGCITDAIRLNPLPYWEAAEFFPYYSSEEGVLAYAIFGGMPRYLAQCDPEVSLAENVIRLALRKGSVFRDEAEFVMRREFREPARYNGILWAMARGVTKVSEIARASLLTTAKASVYLGNLVDASIVERELPVNVGSENAASNGKRGRYRIASNFLRFWYSFVLPNLSDLEMGDAKGVWERRIAPSLWRFAAEPVRRMVADWLRRESLEGRAPFPCNKAGAWWSPGAWIDLVGIGEGGSRAIVGAVDLSTEPVGLESYWRLVEKAAILSVSEKHYVLFSRAGFDPRLAQFAKEDGSAKLVSLGDLYA